MEKFSPLPQPDTPACFRRCTGPGTGAMLSVLLLAAMPSAGATTNGSAFPAAKPPAPRHYLSTIDSIADPREAAALPILVADNGTAGAGWRLTGKVAQAGVGDIAVIYPDIGEPYRSVFTQIIGGIEAKARGPVANFAIGPNVNIDELKNALHHRDTRVVIALGREGMKVAAGLDSSIDVVVGGVFSTIDDGTRAWQVNSLTPDPALLFARLKKMMPGRRRIFTVYDPRQNEWLIRLAKIAATDQGLKLVDYQARDLRSAMHAYKKIFADADSGHDALWLQQDSIAAEESTVMPFVLQESWTAGLATFSSSFAHVKRGILFSLYPDNVGLGRHLADDALGILAASGAESTVLTPLREVLTAVNLRTARHLGLDTNRLETFDMVFPEQ